MASPGVMPDQRADKASSFFDLQPGQEEVIVRSGPELAAIDQIAELEEQFDQEDRA